jgi:hypothetical protein
MPNYVSVCRSNYFKVKDEKRFKRWCAFWSLEHWTDTPKGLEGTYHAIANESGDGWPSSHPETYDDIDFEAELRDHLAPDTIARPLPCRRAGKHRLVFRCHCHQCAGEITVPRDHSHQSMKDLPMACPSSNALRQFSV